MRNMLHREAPNIAREVDRVIVDGPSHISALTRSALLTADLVLVPVQLSPFGRAAFAETLRLVNEANTFRPQLRTRVVLNCCDVRAIVLQAIDAVEALGIDPADAASEHWHHIHNRLSVNEEPRRYTHTRHQAWLHRRRIAP